MKTSSKKLALGKITLRNLGAALSRVRGGGDDNGDTVIDTVEATKDLVTKLPPFTTGDRSAFCPRK